MLNQHEQHHEHPHPHLIHFTLDGEPYTTADPTMTPNQILRDFGHLDPLKYYLVQIEGNHKDSYLDRGNEPIRVHEHARFVSVRIGPTPVSDVQRVGVDVFAAGLKALGYAPEIVDHGSGRLQFVYAVDTGKHAGQTVTLGFTVPADFPLTPPSGPHVSPKIHGGVSQGTEHPNGAIHVNREFGAAFEYWSRPFPDWQAETAKTVQTYIAFIRQLWATQ
jgi:hypothetical protein